MGEQNKSTARRYSPEFRERAVLITPRDPEYREAGSVWNGMVDRYPVGGGESPGSIALARITRDRMIAVG